MEKNSLAKLFFSISPSFGEPETTEAGTQVGLDDDSDYVSGWMNWFLKPFLAVPPSLSSIRDPEQFKLELARALIKALIKALASSNLNCSGSRIELSDGGTAKKGLRNQFIHPET